MKRIRTKFNIFTKIGFTATAMIFALIAAGLWQRSEKSVSAEETPPKIQLARWNEQPQSFSARRGNPWINVLDGKEILTDFVGATEFQASFENKENRPLSLTTADFDEDGMPDIVTGY
ncbi:MAG: VCBS repeat-containing protein [Actinomycetota bacterium]